MRHCQLGKLAGLIAPFALMASLAQAEERVFDLDGFQALNLTSGLAAQVQTGPDFSVISVSDSDEDLADLDFRVVDAVLVMGWAPKSGLSSLFSSHESVVVHITLPIMTGFAASSGANMQVVNVEAPQFDAALSSGANASVEGLVAGQVRVELSSGANANFSGRCQALAATVASGARVSAKSLICERIEVAAHSGGNLSAFATQRALATASGGGNITVYGNPEGLETRVSGGGSISQR